MQFPGEIPVVDSAHYPNSIVRVHIHLKTVISAIHQHEAQNVSLISVCGPVAKRYKRIEIMTAFTRHTSDFGNSLTKSASLDFPFLRIRSAQKDKIRFRSGFSRNIQRTGKYLFQPEHIFACVDNFYAARDNIGIVEYSIGKFELNPVCLVGQYDNESLTVCTVGFGRRESGQIGFSFLNFVALIFERKNRRFSLFGRFQSGKFQVNIAECGIFLALALQKYFIGIVGVKGTMPRRI